MREGRSGATAWCPVPKKVLPLSALSWVVGEGHAGGTVKTHQAWILQSAPPPAHYLSPHYHPCNSFARIRSHSPFLCGVMTVNHCPGFLGYTEPGLEPTHWRFGGVIYSVRGCKWLAVNRGRESHISSLCHCKCRWQAAGSCVFSK